MQPVPPAPHKTKDRADLCTGPLIQWRLGAQSAPQSDMSTRHVQLLRRNLHSRCRPSLSRTGEIEVSNDACAGCKALHVL